MLNLTAAPPGRFMEMSLASATPHRHMQQEIHLVNRLRRPATTHV